MLKQRINPLKFLLTVFLLLINFSVHAAITLSIETNPDPVIPGEAVRTTITVGNTSSGASGAIILQLQYPEHLNSLYDPNISDAGDCPSSYCEPGELVTWTLGNLAPGSNKTVNLPPIVNSDTATGTSITFNVEAFEDATKAATTSRSVVVQSSSVFDIAVDENLNPVAPNESLTYAITYANRNIVSTTDTQLSFPIPTGVSFISASDGGTLNGSVVEWNLQTLSAKKGGHQTVMVSVNPGILPGTQLTVEAATITGQANFLNHSAQAVTTTRVETNNRMALSLELNPDPVQPGESLQSILTISNISGDALFNVTLQLRYAEHLDSLYDPNLSDGGDCPSSYCEPGELVTWSLGNIATGSSTTVTLPPVVKAGTPDGTLITFDAQAFADGNNSTATSHSVVVQSSSIFDITVDEDINPVAPDESLTYAITYSNRGAVSTTDTMLSFPLPTGVSFVSASSGGTLTDNMVKWDLQTLSAKKGHHQTVTVNVNSDVIPGTLLEVEAATITGQANFLDHSAQAVNITRVENSSRIALSLELNPDPVQPGELLQGIVTIGNTSDDALFNVTLQLRFPEHLNSLYDPYISNGGDCPSSYCEAGELITWPLGNIAPGSSTTVTLPPVVNADTPDGSLITFDIEAFADGGNSAMTSHSVVVQSNSVLDIAVDENLNPVAPNQSLTYAITYANRSDISTTDTQLSFPLPTGVSFVSASSGGVLIGNVVRWDLQTFPAKKGGYQTVTVNVDSDVIPGMLLEVEAATITGRANFLDHSARAVAMTRVENNTPMALTLAINPNPAQGSELLQGTLTVDNISGEALFGVTLQLLFPEHLNSLYDPDIPDGDCPSSYCEAGESVTWILGNLVENSSKSVTLPPVVNAAALNGTLISFNANIKEENGRQTNASNTVLVSEFNFVPTPIQTNNLVPDVVAKTQVEAEASISNAGLNIGIVTTFNSDSVAKGFVISQNPASGAKVSPGSSVDLVISAGNGVPLQLKTSFIERLYLNILERAFDQAGLNYWLNEIQTFSATQVAFGFFNSAEFQAKGLNNTEFVETIYRTILDREADQAGLEYWVEELDEGKLREFILYGFFQSDEFAALTQKFGVIGYSANDHSLFLIKNFVRRFYVFLLDRQPELAGLAYWSNELSSGTASASDIATGFFLSDEFKKKNHDDNSFIEKSYLTLLDRNVEQAGRDYWGDQLANGLTRIDLVNSFIESPEFGGLATEYGIRLF